jgi:TetR/AcrR family transcriptional regulator
MPGQNAMSESKSTAERVLDAAEDLFAEQGYSATSLGDVADRVGIRSPSLYNHFRNKEALYGAVVDRLLGEFTAPFDELNAQPITLSRIYLWLETIVRKHHEQPNLARLLQHAALSGGPQTNEIIDRLFRPMFDPAQSREIEIAPKLGAELQPWAVMALNNMVMSYITMAPMYKDLLGQDPFGPEALDKQLKLIMHLAHLALDTEPESGS